MDFDFEKTMAMLSGQSAQDFDANQVSDADKTIINNAIELVYSGLALQQWLTNVTLGVAWNQAFDIMRDMIFSVPFENIMTRYVQWATFDHIRKMKIKITSAAHTNEYIKCPPEKRQTWAVDANTKIQNGMEIIKRKISDYNPNAPRVPVTPSMTPVFREILNTREHNRQHEREREK